ncbi:MAG: hypothetical protein JNJ50_13805 [Acidobacteria bacterium]|nr:hypothetical protein [Acidobacteriota bacterium]
MKVETRSIFRLLVWRALQFAALLGLLLVAPGDSQAQTRGTKKRANLAPPSGSPDLLAGLKDTPGCLGVETAMTTSKKQVIFAWFADKQSLLTWYHSQTHQQAIQMAFPHDKEFDPPLQGVPDDVGPIMAIASITLADKPLAGVGSTLPFSQISIELYKPVTGGIFIGGRFAPEGLKAPYLKDYTPKYK